MNPSDRGCERQRVPATGCRTLLSGIVDVELSDLIDDYQSFQPSLFILKNNEIRITFKNNAQSVQHKPQAPNSFVPYMNEATTLSEMNLCYHCIVQRHYNSTVDRIFVKAMPRL